MTEKTIEIRQVRVQNRRVHMANERTFLAWIRTSIGIMAFGFVVEKFGLFIRQMGCFLEQSAPGLQNPPVRYALPGIFLHFGADSNRPGGLDGGSGLYPLQTDRKADRRRHLSALFDFGYPPDPVHYRHRPLSIDLFVA